MTETVAAIVAAHREGRRRRPRPWRAAMSASASTTIPRSSSRLRDEADALTEAEALSGKDAAQLPLFGVPVRRQGQHRRRRPADHGGLPGLRLYAARGRDRAWRGCAPPARSSIGKTNLDQFATGLVGVRSPYGVPRNAFDPQDLIPGGSSSGLRRRGRGRPRAARARHGYGGLRPRSRRAQQHRRTKAEPRPRFDRGVVPACRTLDCVSVFALTVDDACDRARRDGRARPRRSVFAHPAARRARTVPPACASACRSTGKRIFFGDQVSEAAYSKPRSQRWTALGAELSASRHGAVLRDRAPALRRPVGRRTLSAAIKLIASSRRTRFTR